MKQLPALLVIVLSACTPTPQTTPSPEPSQDTTVVVTAMGTNQRARAKPKGIYYRESSVFLAGDKGVVKTIFAKWPKTALRPRYCAPLARLARSLKGFGGKPVAPASLSKVASQFGIATPWISQTYVVAINYPTSYYVNWLRTTLLFYVGKKKVSHFGFAIVRGKTKGEQVGILLLQKRKITLDPFAQVVLPGKPLRISGKVAADVKKIELLMTWPSGTVSRTAMSLQGTGIFAQAIRFCKKKKAGHYSVELMGEDAHGPVVLALFPVACGGARYLKKSRAVLKAPTKNLKTDVASKEVFTLVNAYRKRRKLKPLRWSRKLAAIAKAHSDEMCKLKSIYHLSPITGAPDARLKRGGLKSDLVAENVAVASSPESIVNSWVMSEGHRLNLILKDGVFGGVGICKATIKKSIHYYATLMVTGKLRQ